MPDRGGFMEKTSILDFISKLSGTDTNRQSDGNALGSSVGTNKNVADGDNPLGSNAVISEKSTGGAEQKSFMRSYNPFSSAESEKRQISAPRAVKPPKNTIDLKNGKNLASEKKNDGSSDMVRFINRHNALAKQINKNNGD